MRLPVGQEHLGLRMDFQYEFHRHPPEYQQQRSHKNQEQEMLAVAVAEGQEQDKGEGLDGEIEDPDRKFDFFAGGLSLQPSTMFFF
ncbi:hypothetical protein [Acidithiobacillus ferrooxidans]|uniref:hypothetical protein n=1 Tax=Acidithiobacillus ferrooxidans TaxID=920 RepID=UPI0012D8849E|nr:hypothetical protein [Acidithiobacillus ferrooxidans]